MTFYGRSPRVERRHPQKGRIGLRRVAHARRDRRPGSETAIYGSPRDSPATQTALLREVDAHDIDAGRFPLAHLMRLSGQIEHLTLRCDLPQRRSDCFKPLRIGGCQCLIDNQR